jgi:hypothetical protein
MDTSIPSAVLTWSFPLRISWIRGQPGIVDRHDNEVLVVMDGGKPVAERVIAILNACGTLSTEEIVARLRTRRSRS